MKFLEDFGQNVHKEDILDSESPLWVYFCLLVYSEFSTVSLSSEFFSNFSKINLIMFKSVSISVHLFYNDQIKDFPLLTEALKFFNHSESMVRTAVRTITLSCFRVKDAAAMSYICDRVANIYFANLTHDLGKLVLEINELTHGNIR